MCGLRVHAHLGGAALVRAWPLLKGYMVSAQLHTSSCEACDENNHNQNI